MNAQPIYLDYAATTPLDPRVLEKMTQVLRDCFGNPSSVTHSFGWQAKAEIEAAREKVAEILGAKPAEIYFTSGATEASNLAILGASEACLHRSNVAVTVSTEHHASLKTFQHLERLNRQIIFVGVDDQGRINESELEAALEQRPALVSIMMVNNETGVIQDIARLSSKIKASGAYFHVDAVQALGKLRVKVDELGVDLLSLSGHKIYGPKGVGALYVRSHPKTPLRPVLFGGNQEKGVRPGTLATHQIAGLGKAVECLLSDATQDQTHSQKLWEKFLTYLALIPKMKMNGEGAPKVSNLVNVQFPGVDAESLLTALPEIAISMGSACTSGTTQPSHVLSAMGLSGLQANQSVRFSWGRFTTLAEIEKVGEMLVNRIAELRALSPIWNQGGAT